MRAVAEVIFKYRNSDTAKVIAELLEIDNQIAPKKMEIKTRSKENTVITELNHDKLHTFFATIDDLLFSERVIEEVLNTCTLAEGRH